MKIVNDKLIVKDEVVPASDIKKIIIGAKSSYIAVPSAKFFKVNELDFKPISIMNTIRSNTIVVTREYDKIGGLNIL